MRQRGYMSSERVLILGASGFIGTHLTEYLYERDYDITVLVREKSTFSILECDKFHIIYGNILDKKDLRKALENIDIVYNLAGIGLNRIRQAKGKEVLFNQDSVKCLAEAIVETGRDIKLVYLSTIKVTGPAKSINDYIYEDSDYQNWDIYGWSKVQAEKILIEYAKKNRMKIIILRAPLILGENDRNCRVLFKMRNWRVKLKLLAKQIPFASFVDVKDLCRIMEQLVEGTDICFDIVNVAHKELIHINMLMDEIYQYNYKKYIKLNIPSGLLFGFMRCMQFLHIKPLLEPERVKDLSEYCWVCDTNRLERKYHLTCDICLKDSVKRIVGKL